MYLLISIYLIDHIHIKKIINPKLILITGCGAAHTAWQIAISETQRQAIYADPKWNNGDVDMK